MNETDKSDQLEQAIRRLSAAASPRTPGGKELIEVDSRDIVAVAMAVKQRTQIVNDLQRGSEPHYEYEAELRRRVFVQADDVMHLLAQQSKG
jgi:hypothetical protein